MAHLQTGICDTQNTMIYFIAASNRFHFLLEQISQTLIKVSVDAMNTL